MSQTQTISLEKDFIFEKSYIHLLLNADGENFPDELITYIKIAHEQAQKKIY